MPRRCVLLFARTPPEEARTKGLSHAEALFDGTSRSIRSAVAALPGVVLLRVRQRGEGFEERLQNAFADAGAAGYQEVVAVPGDVPGLDARRLAQAFAGLAEGRPVLGPCPDGGVYLIGSRGPVGHLLRGIRWRTRFVLSDLQGRFPAALLLPSLADVDRAEDLDRVLADPDLDSSLRALIRRLGHRRPPPAPNRVVAIRSVLQASSLTPRAPPTPV